MKTTYIDPLIPPGETSEQSLTRLSANLGTLTGLMNDAERAGLYSLAAMFDRARARKVAQAEEIIARVTAGGEESADDRRFLLVRGADFTGAVPALSRQRPARSPVQLALPV